MESSSARQSSDDDDELSNKSSLIAIVTTLSRLKRKVLCNRGIDVTEKMRSNSAKLRKYTNGLSESAREWNVKSVSGEDKLTFRKQKVLHNFTNTDAGSGNKDDGPAVAPIIFGGAGGKTAVRPIKLPPQPNVPPYTTWIYLDRNQRMTEDQSVQGRRRIYYDPVGNETLIASDSEEEEPEEEEPKHDFSKGEDYIIWTAVQERGASGLLFEQIAQCIHVNCDEVQARFELLLKDVDKQAKCEAHGEGIRFKVPSPVGRRKGTRDVGRQTFKETKSASKEFLRIDGNGNTMKPDDEKVEAKDLVAAMDSFDNLFCRRCLVFDCRLHGCSQPLVHPSERQPSSNTDSEPTSPCGPHCYLLSQRAHGEASDPLIGMVISNPGELPCSSEGSDRAVAKRRKEDTPMGGEKLGSAITNFDRTANVFPRVAQLNSLPDEVAKLSVNSHDMDITPGRTAESPVVIEDSPCSKREPPTVASRLTSHKKLARSTTRRAIEENGIIGGEAQYRQQEVAFIDLTGMDGNFSRENGNDPQKKVVEGMIGRPINGITGSEQHELKHVSREGHGEEVVFQQEKTRFSSTKKLARSTKRVLEENLQLPAKRQHSQAQVDRMDVDQGELGSGVQEVSMPKMLAKNLKQEQFTGAVSTAPRSAEGVQTEHRWTGADLVKDKGKVTSPKKLARSARKLMAGKTSATVEGQKPLTLGKLLSPSPDRQVRDDSIRNSAARKLARSARKVFAEKLAGAIQQRQLQSQVDLVSKNRAEKENAKEGSFETGGTLQGPNIGGSIVPFTGGEKSQIELNRSDMTCGVNSNHLVNKNRCILADSHEKPSNDGETKGPVLRIDETHKRAAFKDDWTALERGLYEKGLQIFGKSSCMIANNMLKGCKTCAEVREYLIAQEAAAKRGSEGGLHQFPDSLACVLKWDVARARARFYGRRKGSRKLKFTLKSAGQSAIRKRMVNGKDAPHKQFTPCGCLFTCGKQCPCQLNGTCCEKYCGCAKSCKNRFRGCHCAKSQCCSRQCPCFAANRECDPDVCRNCWIGCGDGKLEGPPQREDKDNYQCHNMRLLLKQQQRVLLSRSDVAGWGAFLKNTVSKHEYLGEYTGELISHREADKRGKIYDRENSSFLFNLNDQYVLDACRKGDKLKFANHSPNPNCYAKIMMVAGDHRVGIFAKERILAGEELFYDYRYEADRAPVWAKRGEDSGNGKKDDTGPSERRSKQAS
ncbi:unnamed protein product [Calypogeia fissa]